MPATRISLPRYRARHIVLGLLIPAGLVMTSPTSRASRAERGAPPPVEAPRAAVERAVSELVLIDAFVTDARGGILTGLTRDDFVLIVDGRRTSIASFDVHETVPERAASVTGAKTPTAGATTLSAQESRAAGLPRRFMLFFEDGVSAPAGLTAARRAALQFLATGLTPTDQVAIAAYDMDLRILAEFTTDRDRLRGVIDGSLREARRVSDFAVEQDKHDEEIGRLLSELKQVSGVRGSAGRARDEASWKSFQDQDRNGQGLAPETQALVDQAKTLAGTYGLEEAPRLRGVLRALRTLADSMAGWAGYKALIYMGDGVSENPALPYIDQVRRVAGDDPRLVSRLAESSLTSDLQDLLRAAGEDGVAIHTLQTRGLEAGTARELQAARRRTNALEAIAHGTGGIASSSNDFLKVLSDFEAGSRQFYILGFRPEGPPDGRFHAIQVQCHRREARVRCRNGFTRLTPKDAQERTILAAYTVPEMYPEMDVGLSAVDGPSGPAGRIVDLVVHVPGERILFRPEAGRPTARLEVGLVATDEGRNVTARTSRGLTIVLRPDQGRPGEVGIDLVHRVRLPAGKQSITAVVYDDTAGATGGTRLSLEAEAPVENRILGLSIYSLRDRSLWIEVPAGEADAVAATPPGEYTIGPALKAGYASDEPLVCGFRMPAGEAGPNLEVAILRGDRALKIVDVDHRDAGADGKAHVPLPLEGLEPGEYTVAILEILPSGLIERGRAGLSLRPAGRPADAAAATSSS